MNSIRTILPLLVFFIITNALFIAGKASFDKWNADQEVLIIGNTVIFMLTVVSFLLVKKSFSHNNPNVFVRAVMGGLMIKLFAVIIALVVYLLATQKGFNKAALFICMGLYLVYTVMEVSLLTRLLKRKTNG